MKQAVILKPHEVIVRDTETPHFGSNDLLVRSVAVGICGSDLHALEGVHPFIDLPVVPGHEVAGIVETVGDGVDGFAPGDRVFLEPNLVCGQCFYCLSGRYNLCEHLSVVGCQTAGALAELFTAPAPRFHRVPEGLTMTQAALVEPLSTATHATRLAGSLSGAVVAVLGAGSIGLLTLLAARAAGAVEVLVTDLIEGKRLRALELGASFAADPTRPDAVAELRTAAGRRPDVVFDCVASESSVAQGIALSEKGGTVMVVGVPRRSIEVPLPVIQDREIRVQGSAMYVSQDVTAAVEIMSSGLVDAGRIVTSSFPLDQAPEAFAAARSGEQIKVHITFENRTVA